MSEPDTSVDSDTVDTTVVGTDVKESLIVGATAYFVSNGGDLGYELWKTDGTYNGTVLVKEIKPGNGYSAFYPQGLVAIGTTLYFSSEDGTHGAELWKSDGTAAGTVMVKDIRAGSIGSGPSGIIVAGTSVYFTADDGVNGVAVWKSDGTEAGTQLAFDAGATGLFAPSRLVYEPASQRLFFVASGANGRRLYVVGVTP